MSTVLNLALLRNPWNWIIVYLMVAFGVLLFTLADPFKAAGATPGDPANAA